MNNIEINDKLETDIENKYIKDKENVKFTTEEAIYILKRKDFCDEVENIAINRLIEEITATSKIAGIIENLIIENKELKENQIWSEATIEGLKKDFVPVAKLKEIIYGDYEDLEIILKIQKLVEGE